MSLRRTDDDRLPGAGSSAATTGVVGRLVQVLLDAGIDGLGPAEVGARARRRWRVATPARTEGAVKKIVRSHVVKGGVGGFVTSVGGFVTMPVALPANVVEFYVGATRMVAAIATLRGYDVDDPQVRTAVLLTLVGSEADEVLAKAGLTGGGRQGGRPGRPAAAAGRAADAEQGHRLPAAARLRREGVLPARPRRSRSPVVSSAAASTCG